MPTQDSLSLRVRIRRPRGMGLTRAGRERHRLTSKYMLPRQYALDGIMPPRAYWKNGLGRPRADTLNGSKHANMKELRFDADDGVWRVAFAFDPRRKAILLVAGDKSGVSKDRFYKALIGKADERFEAHLERLKKTAKGAARKQNKKRKRRR